MDGSEPVATATLAASDENTFIDREPIKSPATLPPFLLKLSAEASKVSNILSKVNTYGGVALKALEMLGYLQSQAQIEQARFDALHLHLDNLGVELVEVQLAIERDNRLSLMRTSVNNINIYAQRGHGRIDESVFTEPGDVEEYGNARTDSQNAAQNSTNISAHRGYYHETATNGDHCSGVEYHEWFDDVNCWKRYISARPAPNGSAAYDWRLGTTEMLQLIASRLAIIGITDPDFRHDGERMAELGQYRTSLSDYYDMIMQGIHCWGIDGNPVRVGCVDINTGLESSTTFTEPSCHYPYNHTTCQARIAPVQERLKRSLMTYLPLFQIRTMMDALAMSMGTNDELTTNPRIRMSGTQNCLYNSPVVEFETNPFEPTPVPGQWTAAIATCGSDVAQEWHYDRGSGRIKNAWGACLGQRSFDLNHPFYGSTLWVKECTDSGSEHWTHDPWSGVLENAFHTVLGAEPQGSTWGPPWAKAELRGASATQAWQSPPFEFQALPRQIEAVPNADESLGLFFIGAGGPLLHHSQNGANGAWRGEPALGGQAKQLAMARNADGRLEIFYIGTDNAIYHDFQTTPGGHWYGEVPFGGAAKQIAVGRNLDGRLEVFYVGTDDAVYHSWQVAPNDAWAGHYALGGWAKQIAVGQNLDGRLHVFYIGTNDAIYHNRQVAPNGGWAGEVQLAGWAKQITVARNQDGRLELFAIGTNDSLYHNWQSTPNGEFAGEWAFGGAAKLLVMGQNQDGRLEAFYIGMDDNLYRKVQVAPNGGWAGEVALGDTARQLAVARNQDGRQELFFVTSDGTVFRRSQVAANSATWSSAVAFP